HQVWLLKSWEEPLGTEQRETREIFLWDLGGQPHYRLTHQLSLSDVTVALVVYSARNTIDPFADVKYWDRALRTAHQTQEKKAHSLKKILVAAKSDVGTVAVSQKDRETFIAESNFVSYFETNAATGKGIKELHEAIFQAINWEDLTHVTSTFLF